MLLLPSRSFWGGAFYFNVIALRGFPPNMRVFLRILVAAIPLLLLLSIVGQRLPREAKSWSQLAILSRLNIVLLGLGGVAFIIGATR
jgi:drug/metabolite transporter (DMT)-like permease